MEIGAVFFVLGLVMSILSYVYNFGDNPAFLAFYDNFIRNVPGADAEGYNLLFMLLGTLFLIGGGWYFGEQLVLRRRFERLISTAKKSDFVSHRKDLDELASRLPRGYRGRIEEKENSFRSLR